MSRSGSAPEARKFYVRGRVQGVGFRYFVERQAGALGVAGHARNLDDGRVEVLAQGAAEALERLAVLLREGPALSRVDGLESHPSEIRPELAGFRIAH